MTHLRGAIEQFAETGYARGTAGERIISVSFLFTLAASSDVVDSYGEYEFPAVPDGFEHVYQNLTISTPEDEFIHAVRLLRKSTGVAFFWSSFVNYAMFDFPGEPLVAGESLLFGISNGADEQAQYVGVINYVERKV